MIESGKLQSVGENTLRRICLEFAVNFEWLKNGEGKIYEISPMTGDQFRLPGSWPAKVVPVPLLGSVPAGIPAEAATDVIEYVPVPVEHLHGQCFCLRVRGFSMSPTVEDEETIVVCPDAPIRDKDIVVVTNEFGDVMLRRYRLANDGRPWLLSDNPQYGKVAPGPDYRIVGRVMMKVTVY
jgi:SOS-response transcriptional repressor LexA